MVLIAVVVLLIAGGAKGCFTDERGAPMMVVGSPVMDVGR